MKKIIFFLIIIILFLSCSNSNRKNSDLKKNLTKKSIFKKDSLYVTAFSEFNVKDIGKIDSIDCFSKIKLQKFSAKNINELLLKKKVCCLFFWAWWCKGCKRELDIEFRDIIKKHNKDINFAIISVSSNLRESQEELFKLKYFIQTYVLDSSIYKSDSEFDDWPIFTSYLNSQFPKEKFDIYLPMLLIINKKKEIISKDPDIKNLDSLLTTIEKRTNK